MVQNPQLLGQLNGRTEARTESRPPRGRCSTSAAGPPREIRVFRIIGGPANSTLGLRAESPAQPHFPRAESTPAPTHWRCHGAGTRRPPPRSRFPTRPRPPSRKRIRKSGLLLRLLLQPQERLR